MYYKTIIQHNTISVDDVMIITQRILKWKGKPRNITGLRRVYCALRSRAYFAFISVHLSGSCNSVTYCVVY